MRFGNGSNMKKTTFRLHNMRDRTLKASVGDSGTTDNEKQNYEDAQSKPQSSLKTKMQLNK